MTVTVIAVSLLAPLLLAPGLWRAADRWQPPCQSVTPQRARQIANFVDKHEVGE